ncbi:MAG TPA: NADPH-dependent glutamate synthase [Anaerolineae bacterium]|nr:NADPH-dependent glutamate synthase [Anaerolineae bacterium]
MKKNKMSIPRQPMKEQSPEARVKNFYEVPFGYDQETAMLEAQRCLQCKNKPCVDGCPVYVDIPAFIKLISEGSFIEAAWKIKETNSLPAICGRVCPQEDQCEKLCVRGKKGEPVAIGRLERFAADYERHQGKIVVPNPPPPTGKKIAVIGSGPSGLTVAGDLAKLGHEVTVFEALHKSGGVLVYGIPEFRLPKSIVEAEVSYLEKCGIRFELNTIIGRIETIDELFDEGFVAVYVASGAGAPVFMGIPGENLGGIFSANEYLTRSNLMKGYLFPKYDTPMPKSKKVVVLGGGNVAMDSARTALRLGPEKVIILYRRSAAELPARREEIHHAEEEGVEFQFLTAPIEFLGDDKKMVQKVKCIRMELGEPDDSGRRRPIPIPGSEFEVDTDTVIIAIGNLPNPLIPKTTPDLPISRRGNILADETGKTGKKGVFAGGDIVTGAATVIQAMGAGRIAAYTIHEYIMGNGDWTWKEH